ncbi:MAG: D-alanine--D-alanine ligase [Pirellulales bacterium]
MFDDNVLLFDDCAAPLRVAVLLGGQSSERDISLASGHCVVDALRRRGHGVEPIDPAEVDLFDVDWDAIDVCFIALHGGSGEDGRIQSELAALGVPYTGSGPTASRLAMSKRAAKRRFHQCRVPTPPGISFDASECAADVVDRMRPIPFPWIIKPDGQGCSLGVSIARRERDIDQCIAKARRFEQQLLAEQFVCGHEYTVGLLDRQPLSPLEIVRSRPVFDFDSKFGSAAVDHVFSGQRDTTELIEIAIKAADALGAGGLVRIDMIRGDTGSTWVLELNTIPGLTKQSLIPIMAEQMGIAMPELCEHLARVCMCQGTAV